MRSNELFLLGCDEAVNCEQLLSVRKAEVGRRKLLAVVVFVARILTANRNGWKEKSEPLWVNISVSLELILLCNLFPPA